MKIQNVKKFTAVLIVFSLAFLQAVPAGVAGLPSADSIEATGVSVQLTKSAEGTTSSVPTQNTGTVKVTTYQDFVMASALTATAVQPSASQSAPVQTASAVVTVPTVKAPPTTPLINAAYTLSGNKTTNTSIWISLGGGDYVEAVTKNAATTWSYNVTLSNGPNDFKILAKNAVGDPSAVVLVPTITYDQVDAVTVVTPPTGALINPTYTLSGTKAANTSIWISTDGGKTYPIQAVKINGDTAWSYNATLKSGVNNFMIIEKNASLNPSAPVTVPTITYTPVAAVTVKAPPTTTLINPTYTLSGTKAANTSLWISIGGGDYVEAVTKNAATTWSYNVTLSHGPNDFKVLEKNASGNPSAAVTVPRITYAQVDAVTVVTPPTGALINPTYTLSGTKAANTSIWISTDGGKTYPIQAVKINGDTAWSYNATLKSGANDFMIIEKNASLNSSAPVTVPTITYTPVAAVTVKAPPTTTLINPTYTLSGTKAANTSLWISSDDGVHYTEVVANNTATTWAYNVTLVTGVNNFKVLEKNASGNPSAAVAVPKITYSIVPSVTVNPTTVDQLIHPSYALSGTKAANTSIWISTDGGKTFPLQAVPLNGSTAWSYSVTLKSGANDLMIIEKNASSNPSVAVAVPTITYAPVTVTSPTGVVINPAYALSGTKASKASIWVSTDAGKTYTQVVSNSEDTLWSYGVTLVKGTAYNFKVMERNTAGVSSAVVTVPKITYDSVAPVTVTSPSAAVSVPAIAHPLSGSKAANTSIWISADGGITYALLVAANTATTWSANVDLLSGANNFMIVEKNANLNSSVAVIVPTITNTLTAADFISACGATSTLNKCSYGGDREPGTLASAQIFDAKGLLTKVVYFDLGGSITAIRTVLPSKTRSETVVVDGKNCPVKCYFDAKGNAIVSSFYQKGLASLPTWSQFWNYNATGTVIVGSDLYFSDGHRVNHTDYYATGKAQAIDFYDNEGLRYHREEYFPSGYERMKTEYIPGTLNISWRTEFNDKPGGAKYTDFYDPQTQSVQQHQEYSYQSGKATGYVLYDGAAKDPQRIVRVVEYYTSTQTAFLVRYVKSYTDYVPSSFTEYNTDGSVKRSGLLNPDGTEKV